MKIVHVFMGILTAEITGESIEACLMACAQLAEAGWAIEETTTVYYRGTTQIQSYEVWFAGGGMVHFDHIRGNLYSMTHL